MAVDSPYLWIIDSSRSPLAGCLELFEEWATPLYLPSPDAIPGWDEAPDAIIVSAEIRGGAGGEDFARLVEDAGGIPILAMAKLRSLAQALAFFRAGASDYIPLPFDEEEIRERLRAARERAERLAMPAVMVELERVGGDSGEVSLSLISLDEREEPDGAEEEDILAGIAADLALAPPDRKETERPAEAESGGEEPESAGEAEPEPVDGLPIPTLWEELPCGLLVFDSRGNLVFSNSLGLELFGHASLAELQETLENRLADFAAHAANHKPLADNQWPQVLARKTRMARSAVLSIEKPDKRRIWLRIDCLPHLSEGRITRLSMTLVNMTGELPALNPPVAKTEERRERPKAKGRRRK